PRGRGAVSAAAPGGAGGDRALGAARPYRDQSPHVRDPAADELPRQSAAASHRCPRGSTMVRSDLGRLLRLIGRACGRYPPPLPHDLPAWTPASVAEEVVRDANRPATALRPGQLAPAPGHPAPRVHPASARRGDSGEGGGQSFLPGRDRADARGAWHSGARGRWQDPAGHAPIATTPDRDPAAARRARGAGGAYRPSTARAQAPPPVRCG